MKIYRYAIIYIILLLFVITVFQAFPVAMEEKKPRDEKTILVPKGAQPVLKEEYPKGQLVEDRIKARHRYALSIPFVHTWNTAALTLLGGLEEDRNDIYEAGFALHSQRLHVGALKNKEYFQRETAGYPEGRYWSLPLFENVNLSKGYMSTNFVHLAVKRVRSSYLGYNDFYDRVNGVLNVSMKQNQNLSMTAQRYMQNFGTEYLVDQPRTKNVASILYKKLDEGATKLEIQGDSVWSTLTDATQKEYGYLSGAGFVTLGRNINPDFNVDLKAKIQIANLRDQTSSKDVKTFEKRRMGRLEVSNLASLPGLLKLKLNASAIYDSKYRGYITPDVELALVSKIIQLRTGLRRQAILPDFDELYWQSKSVKVNKDIKAESFWETYGSLNLDIITRLKLLAEASYSRPGSRITWDQLPGYVWEPVNKPTSEAIAGKATLGLNLFKDFNIFALFKYQRFDQQLFDPEKIANAGIYYGSSIGGSITLGACYWNFQAPQDSKPEDRAFAYLRINKSLLKVFNIFIDGRYTFSIYHADGHQIVNQQNIIYYCGSPQAGRIVSVGANIVFGGLE